MSERETRAREALAQQLDMRPPDVSYDAYRVRTAMADCICFLTPKDAIAFALAFADAELERIAHEVDSYLMTKTSLEVGHIVEVTTLIRTR